MNSSILTNESADRAAMSSLISARICLERRRVVPTAGTFEEQAFYVYFNSHRFRRRGLDGKVWRLNRG